MPWDPFLMKILFKKDVSEFGEQCIGHWQTQMCDASIENTIQTPPN